MRMDTDDVPLGVKASPEVQGSGVGGGRVVNTLECLEYRARLNTLP